MFGVAWSAEAQPSVISAPVISLCLANALHVCTPVPLYWNPTRVGQNGFPNPPIQLGCALPILYFPTVGSR
jgi:hypothetical protein